MANTNTNCLEGMRCPSPECGSEGAFRIVGLTTATMGDDGADEYEGLEYDGKAPCRCVACGHQGIVAEFREHDLTTRSTIYLDVFETRFADGSTKAGFSLDDESGHFPIEIHDEWKTLDEFKKQFPEYFDLLEYIQHDTRIGQALMRGAAILRARGQELWGAGGDITVQGLVDAFGAERGLWGEVPAFPRTDWRHAVAKGDTLQGYWEWALAEVENMKEGWSEAVSGQETNLEFREWVLAALAKAPEELEAQ
ncbi:MAG: hypothetical protein CVV05_00370 [Gammaproteobacteria bacterium HGW-Gammaproteobacteria-1]|nr:MAG: hypothetical protein CVV05_00370 [Gammaproteobacteria bacterium HGW-Gammaproteobacteria-1]